jgi:hypothetical protein
MNDNPERGLRTVETTSIKASVKAAGTVVTICFSVLRNIYQHGCKLPE